MNGNFGIGRFCGIEFRFSWSQLAVFALIVWSLTDGVFPSQNPGLSHGTYVAMGIVAAVLFLASIERDLRVRDLMPRHPVTVDADSTLGRFMEVVTP